MIKGLLVLLITLISGFFWFVSQDAFLWRPELNHLLFTHILAVTMVTVSQVLQ